MRHWLTKFSLIFFLLSISFGTQKYCKICKGELTGQYLIHKGNNYHGLVMISMFKYIVITAIEKLKHPTIPLKVKTIIKDAFSSIFKKDVMNVEI